ncbi:hypothetical protein GA0070624_2871 [Micromonospora rhizosphaerae]|uniref:Nucleotidyltransferase n=1 Tax=Micromonospora rhizosphaerae TaxID=568872 RepID=A0A1C6S4G4_9ACTN|nr:hypothetical protein [Micromonospora rhizosphaerae]SCL24174.1 hypothetical protein GA0070624_2871 [Micromonospora rhizosphaerae]
MATAAVTAAVWRGEGGRIGDDLLALALREAERNQVQGLLARACPDRLSGLLRSVEEATGQFRYNLAVATARLRDAGVRPVLIKADPDGDYVYTNFDLVVGDQWEAARDALAGWYVRTSAHSLEPDKLLLHPARGPAAHLHRTVSWFGIPVVAADRLVADAGEAAAGWLVPSPDDQLRIWLAHAVFQNLAFDLSELMAIRSLLRPETVAEAEEEAQREGWRGAFTAALRTARQAIRRLDDGDPLPLPVPLPASASIAVAREHVRHLARTGQGAAARREVVLRGPLTMVKRCRLALA